MTTPTIDIGLVQYFSPVFLLILVFAVIYGTFQWAKILGDNKVLHATIAFIVALFVAIFSDGARAMVSFMVPWFTMLAILITFSIMLYKIFGATDADVRSFIRTRADAQWTLFIVIVIIVLGALANAYGQNQLPITNPDAPKNADGTIDQGSNLGNPGTTDTTSGNFKQNLGATFYHPKVLGMLLLFIIGAITVSSLARPVFKS